MGHSSAFLKLVDLSRARIKETDVTEIMARLAKGDKFHLVDVREDHEWEKGHIPGAIHLGRGILERDIESAIADKGAEIVLYCGGGFRSALSAENLQLMGYTKVLSMDGGYRGWVDAKGAVEK